MRLWRVLPLLCALAALVAAPASASANEFQRIFRDYKSDGRLNGCYEAYELHNASRQIPPDIEQYAPGFGDALAAAQGGCPAGGGGGASDEESVTEPSAGGGAAPAAPATAATRVVKEPPAPERAASPPLAALPRPTLERATVASSGTPGALIVLLVAAAIALLLALAWAIAWLMGWSPERLTRPLTAAFGSVFGRR